MKDALPAAMNIGRPDPGRAVTVSQAGAHPGRHGQQRQRPGMRERRVLAIVLAGSFTAVLNGSTTGSVLRWHALRDIGATSPHDDQIAVFHEVSHRPRRGRFGLPPALTDHGWLAEASRVRRQAPAARHHDGGMSPRRPFRPIRVTSGGARAGWRGDEPQPRSYSGSGRERLTTFPAALWGSWSWMMNCLGTWKGASPARHQARSASPVMVLPSLSVR